MPLKGIFLEPNTTNTTNSQAAAPDLSLHISLPNTTSFSSSTISNSKINPTYHKSTTASFTELSLTHPANTHNQRNGGAQEPQINPFQHRHHHQNQSNNSHLNHMNHGASLLHVSPSSDSFRPIKGIPVYHNRTFPFLPLDHNHREKDPKMCFYPTSSYPSNSSSHSPPYFGANLDHMSSSILNNAGPNGSSSAAYRVSGAATRFNGLSSYHHHHHHNINQFGVGASEASHHHAMSRSRFLPKLPAKRSMRAPRMRWTSTLHARFVHAVELLGGHESK